MIKIILNQILILTLSIISFDLNAQTKYEFTSSGMRSGETYTEFWGKSKDRKLSVKWNNDIWLSPYSNGLDSISRPGFIEIDDNHKGITHLLKVIPTDHTLSYHFTKNEKPSTFVYADNIWFKSLLQKVLYPYMKATFHNRFFRNLEELITVKVGSKFPRFDKVDINGNRISNKDFQDKLIIINFWNIYCVPCIKEMPELNKLKKKYNSSEKYKFISFSSSSEKQITKLFKKKKIKFDYLQIPNSIDIENSLGFRFNPVSLILDSKGIIKFMSVGYSQDNTSQMDKILEEESKKMTEKNLDP